MTTVIVPPNLWHPIHTTGTEPDPDQPDHRMVTECYHTNPGNIMLTISNGIVHNAGDPHPYQTRTIPYEDHLYQQLVQAHRPTPTPTPSQ